MLIRLPGESRSYLCSHEASVCMAEEVIEGRAPRYWLHLEAFDSSHVQRPREAELALGKQRLALVFCFQLVL